MVFLLFMLTVQGHAFEIAAVGNTYLCPVLNLTPQMQQTNSRHSTWNLRGELEVDKAGWEQKCPLWNQIHHPTYKY